MDKSHTDANFKIKDPFAKRFLARRNEEKKEERRRKNERWHLDGAGIQARSTLIVSRMAT